jgi:two-component system OmpR family sensor kinase
VLVGVLTVTLAVLASFCYAAIIGLHGYLLSKTDASLESVLTGYEPMLTSDLGAPSILKNPGRTGRAPTGPAAGRPLQIPSFLDEYEVELRTGQRTVLQIVQGDTNLVPVLPDDLAALAADHGSQTVMSRNGRTELRLMAASGNGETLIVTTSLESLDNTVSWLTIIFVVGMLSVGLLVYAGVGMVVRRGLRSVETMAAAADRITAGDLTSRVSPHDPATEVGRLGAALNGMLARIQIAVQAREASEQAARQFLADASHELRTPLASLRANAELHQQGALPHREQVDEAMSRITAEAKRMGILVDDMLRLARLDQHPSQDHRAVDLTALIAECAERARIASPERTWHVRIASDLVAVGDEEMLRRAIDNLLANVIAHTPAGTTATATAADGDGTITVEVSDNGPGLPANQLPRIFDRFYRAPARTHRSGSGLGLAIVSAVAAAHHGTAEAAPNHPHGLRVTLQLPAYRQPLQAAGRLLNSSIPVALSAFARPSLRVWSGLTPRLRAPHRGAPDDDSP